MKSCSDLRGVNDIRTTGTSSVFMTDEQQKSFERVVKSHMEKSRSDLRGLKDIRSVNDIRRVKDIRTTGTSSVFMTDEERELLESVMDFRALGIDTSKEIDRVVRQNRSVEKSRMNLLKARVRLAAKVNKNRALMKLKHELQRGRWEKIAGEKA